MGVPVGPKETGYADHDHRLGSMGEIDKNRMRNRSLPGRMANIYRLQLQTTVNIYLFCYVKSGHDTRTDV